MYQLIRKIIFNGILLVFSSSIFGMEHPCPLPDQIKSVRFTEATRFNGMWIMFSNIIYNNNQWRVGFATIMLNAETSEAALKEGQEYFDRVPIIIENPIPDKENGKLHCSYVPLGEKYFIFANT